MNWDEIVRYTLSLIIGSGFTAAVLKYLQDRKKAGAEGEVAVQTIELQVDHTRMQNLETRFALAERAWDEERESLTRRVTAAENRETALEQELVKKDSKIRMLEERVGAIQNELIEVTRELAGLRSDRDA